MKTPLCAFFLVGKQWWSQARLELDFWIICNWPVTEVTMEHSRPIRVVLSSTGARLFPFKNLFSFEKRGTHFPESLESHGLLVSGYEVPAALISSVKWLDSVGGDGTCTTCLHCGLKLYPSRLWIVEMSSHVPPFCLLYKMSYLIWPVAVFVN